MTRLTLVCLWACFCACIAVASEPNKTVHVLILHAYEETLPWTSNFMAGVQQTIQQQSDFNVQVYQENLYSIQLPNLDKAAFAKSLSEKYGGVPLDAVVASAVPASEFLITEGVFADRLRILYTLKDRKTADNDLLLRDNQQQNIQRTLEIMRAQNPGLNRIVLIESGAPAVRNIVPLVERVIAGWSNVELDARTSFVLPTLLNDVSQLPNDTAIFMGTVFSDSTGKSFRPPEVMKDISIQSAVPVYTSYSTLMGTGSVGGHLVDPALLGRRALSTITESKSGVAESEPVNISQTVIDVAALKRWDLNLVLNEPILRINEPPSWFETHVRTLTFLLAAFVVLFLVSMVWTGRLRILNHRLLNLQKQLHQRNRSLLAQSLEDPLTGLLNRRAMMPRIEAAVSEMERYGLHSTLLLIDLDNFKWVNDKYGHGIGDLLLKSFANILTSESRKTDALSRWGGEEFLILAKGTTAAEACRYLQKVQTHVHTVQQIEQNVVTFSAGVCEITENTKIEQLIHQADTAMYEAKSKGKDCFVTYTPEMSLRKSAFQSTSQVKGNTP